MGGKMAFKESPRTEKLDGLKVKMSPLSLWGLVDVIKKVVCIGFRLEEVGN